MDDNRYFKIMLWLFIILTIIVIINIIVKGINWNEVFIIPRSGTVTFLIILTLALPAIFNKTKFGIQKLKLIYLAYSGKLNNFEQWNEYRRIYSLIKQDANIDYYYELRKIISDDDIFNRISQLTYNKGDDIIHVLLSLGNPQYLIRYRVWLFHDKYAFYYFPFYERKSLRNIFKIKFKYEFIFMDNKLTELKIDGISRF